jgi:hypothetical protein
MLKSFHHLINVDPGFNTQKVLAADISLPKPRYPEPRQQMRFTSN